MGTPSQRAPPDVFGVRPPRPPRRGLIWRRCSRRGGGRGRGTGGAARRCAVGCAGRGAAGGGGKRGESPPEGHSLEYSRGHSWVIYGAAKARERQTEEQKTSTQREPFGSTQGKQQKLECVRLLSSSDLPRAGGRAKQLCSAPPLLTLRNLWRRKANQFVSIFSATDSVLGKPGRGEAHYQQNQILARANLRKEEWPETGGEEHPAPHA